MQCGQLVKIMIWAGIVVITFAIAVRVYPIFIFLLKERRKPLVEALKDEILSNSWLYSPFFGIIASFTAGLTACRALPCPHLFGRGPKKCLHLLPTVFLRNSTERVDPPLCLF
jgi:hypothetical protein